VTAPISIAATVVDRMRERWAQVDPGDLDGSWSQQIPGAVQILAAGQILAATRADAQVANAVGRSDLRVNAPGFAGRAADGRSLTTLLEEPVIAVKMAILAGQALDEALGRGLVRLTMAAGTEVSDAGRLATGAAITARPQVHGYVRVVNAPACGRCIVLAGRVYRWSDGFQRHPRCDCTMAPAASADTKPPQSPRELFDAMDSSEQERAFTAAGAKAIRDGADLSRVVNAQRGMYEAGGRSLTTEATTRRGRPPGQAEGARLTPLQVYREAGDDRAEAIGLLRRHGYLTG
jgi:hypothetical protein